MTDLITGLPHKARAGEQQQLVDKLYDEGLSELVTARETIAALERTIQNAADMIDGAHARADAAEAKLAGAEASYQEMKAAALHYEDLHRISKGTVARIWELFGTPSYAELDGRTIFDLVRESIADAKRYRYLRDHCSSHYPMTHEQPAEWSIGWEFQQRLPEEAYGSFDHWIDLDIETTARRQAEIDAEDEASYVASMFGELENSLGPCPECGAPAGMDCRTVQGRIPPHEARCGAERRTAHD